MSFNLIELEDIVKNVPATIQRIDNGELSYKPDPQKWSKKEIFGHLVDSAHYNLKRFTETLYEAKPYRVYAYNQDELVRINEYHDMHIEEILELWTILNKHIIYIVRKMSDAELGLFVHLPDNTYKTLEWLIQDYIVHLQHHLKQIFDTP